MPRSRQLGQVVAYTKYEIGRLPGNHIVLDDPSVSRQHAVLITEDQVNFDLCDISGAGGVYLLGPQGPVRIQRARVSLGDRVLIGRVEVQIGDFLTKVGLHPHVFISYSRKDRDKSQIVAQSLKEHGLRVWWDDQLEFARPYDEQLEAQVKASSSVLVLWSQHSVASSWVRAEAALGLDRGVLMPVLIEHVEVPILFRQLQAHFVTGWSTPALADELTALAQKIKSFLRIKTDPAVPHTGSPARGLDPDDPFADLFRFDSGDG
jgi:hypothetical protein